MAMDGIYGLCFAGCTHLRKLLCALAMLLIANGCAESKPGRFDVSGKVTHQGELLLKGTITFDPDASAGNSGPQGFARIRDGSFSTEQSGKGTLGGQHVVRIIGEMGPDPAKPGNVFYVNHRMQLDLPKERIVRDIEIPSESVESLPARPDI